MGKSQIQIDEKQKSIYGFQLPFIVFTVEYTDIKDNLPPK